MKKVIYEWANADYKQVIRFDAENEVFEIETVYDPKLKIERKLSFIGRHEFEAMNKAFGGE